MTHRMVLVACLASLQLSSCQQRDDQGWHLDANYSMQLTVLASNPEGRAASGTADEVKLFEEENRHDDMHGLSEFSDRKPTTQLSEAKQVEAFLEASQQMVATAEGFSIPGCFEGRSDRVFHALVYDRELSRVGYFLLRTCQGSDGKEYAIVRGLQKGGGSSIYYSSAVVPYLPEANATPGV